MTVSTSYAPLSFNGDDATTAFAVTWPFFDSSLVVTLVDSTGVETVKTITTHYTVSGGTDSDGLPATGTVTMLTAPASGETLRITRNTSKVQSSSWTNGGAYQAKTLEASLDRAMLIAQENAAAASDALDGITGDVMQLNTSGATDYWDAEDQIVRNVLDPVADDDAANRGWVTAQIADSTFGSAGFQVATKAALQLRALSFAQPIFVEEDEFQGWYYPVTDDLSSTLVVSTVAASAVAGGTGNITSTAHGLRTGDGVLAATAVNGLSLNTVYYVIKVDADNFKLATTRALAAAGTATSLTGTTTFSVKKLLDPDQYTYVILEDGEKDGSGGAFVRLGATNTGKGWANQTPPTRVHRLMDRVMVGPGAAFWTGEQVADGGTGSWLMDEGEGSVTMAYLLVNAQLAAVTSGNSDEPPYGILGAAKTPTGAASTGAIGIAGYASGKATSGSSVAWGGYFDAVKAATSNVTTEGIEVEITNLNSTPVAAYTPYSTYVQGRCFGMLIGCGGDDSTVHPTSYDAEAAINIFENGAQFRSGIVFRQEALTKDATTNYQHAILLPINARVEWYHSDDITAAGRGFSINSQVSSATYRQSMLVQDGGLYHYGPAGDPMFYVQFVASSVNYVSLVPSATGNRAAVLAGGSDASVGLDLRSKSDGVVNLQTRGGSVTGLQVQDTASGVNQVYVKPGAAGNAAIIGSQGDDTNVNLDVVAKGTGSVLFKTNAGSVTAAAVQHTASGVNYLTLAPSATGNAVTIGAAGSDSNVDITITPKGSGAVNIPALNLSTLACGYMLDQSAVASSHTGDTSKTTLATIAIPAGAMGANGYVEIEMVWSYTNSANSKTMSVELGGSTLMSVSATTTAAATNRFRIWNRNSASSQIGSAVTGGIGAGTGNATSAIDTSSAANITISGTLANSGETITLEAYHVRLYYKA